MGFVMDTKALRAGIAKADAIFDAKAKRAMNDAGFFVDQESKKRSPQLTGMLTADITHITVEHNGSYAALIYVPENAPSAGYAIKMHEGTYSLGENSIAKEAKTGRMVGKKYMLRALDDEKDKIFTIVAEGMKI